MGGGFQPKKNKVGREGCRKPLSHLSYLDLKSPAARCLSAYLWLPGCLTPTPLCPLSAAPVWKTGRSRGHVSDPPASDNLLLQHPQDTTPTATNHSLCLANAIKKLLQHSGRTLDIVFMLTDSLMS